MIERIRLVEGGDVLETELTIEDPDALLKPLHLVHQQRKVDDPMTESFCNESLGDPFKLDAEPIPEDSTPDF